MEVENCELKSRFRVSQSYSCVGYTHVLCCPCCMFFTLSFANLHKHALTHNSSQLSSYRTYTCSKCSSTSTEKYLMLEHVNIYHRNTKKPVELTEGIHTILRKPSASNKIDLQKGSMSRLTNMRNLKIEMKKRKFSPAFRTYSKIQQRVKLKSRINKYSMTNALRSFKSILTQENVSPLDIKKLGLAAEIPITNENEPLDMTIKNCLKGNKGLSSDPKVDDKESKFPIEYMNSYQNIRSYLCNFLSKNSLPPGLSQSFMLRYLTAQFQSLQAAKYLNPNTFMGQPSTMTNQDKSIHLRIFDNQPSLTIPKMQDNSGVSLNPRNLHRNNFSPFQNHILLEWYDSHKHKPYPSTEETKHLATMCNLSYPQVKKWFANKRARSSFYQKDDMMPCPNQARYNLLRFPSQIGSRLNFDELKNQESQFSNSADNVALISSSSQEDSILST